jgi:hypothetical protein
VAAVLILLGAGSLYFQGLSGLGSLIGFPAQIAANTWLQVLTVVVVLALIWGHFSLRRRIGKRLIAKTVNSVSDSKLKARMQRILSHNIRWWRSIFCTQPAGLGISNQNVLDAVMADSREYIQKLNDIFTNPSGPAREDNQKATSAWARQDDK